MKQGLFFFCAFFLATDISFAAGIIMRVQQMKSMKQQQSQQEYQREYLLYQQQQQQTQGQQAAHVQPTYQQQVDQRNQAIAQAILDSHNQAVSSVNLQGSNNTAATQPQQRSSGSGVGPAVQSQASSQQVAFKAGSSDVKDVVDLSEVWKKLDKKSTVWALLIDDQAKLLTVSEYIERFRQEGAKINAPPAHYVQLTDQIAQENPQMLQRPFGELLQILAIVDYDFDNGMDKDLLARKVLGDAGFEANKKRFTQQQ